MTRFRALEAASFAHSIVYAGLLYFALTDGDDGIRYALGWTHGLMWIVMSLCVIAGARHRILSWRLAVLVAVVGGVGPFAGTIGFVLEDRSRSRGVNAGETPA